MKAKRSIHWDLSFLVNICKWRKRRKFTNRVLFSPSEYYHCESIEDVHENDSRSCQVSFSFFVFRRRDCVFVEEEWSSFRWWTFIWSWLRVDHLWNLFRNWMFGKSDIDSWTCSVFEIFFSSFSFDTFLFDLLGFICCRSIFSRSYWHRRWKDDYTWGSRTLVDHRYYSSHLWQIDARRWFQLGQSTLNDSLVHSRCETNRLSSQKRFKKIKFSKGKIVFRGSQDSAHFY